MLVFPELPIDISKNARVVCSVLQIGLLKPGGQLNLGSAWVIVYWTLIINQIADFIFAELIC